MNEQQKVAKSRRTTNVTRLPRFKRVSNPPPMVLTSRDREVLHYVHAFHLMIREQIERLIFPPDQGQDHATKTSRARKRLKLLYQHGYLERIPMPVSPSAWGWCPVYRLGRRGAELVAADLGIPVARLKYWGRGDDQDHRRSAASLLFLQHALQVNDVRIAVIQAARREAHQIEKWLDDSALKGEEMRDWVTVSNGRGGPHRVTVIPDAYFILHLGDRRAHFFLELDRATMSNERWKGRVLAYQGYVKSGRYQERYQTRSLRILTVTTTEKRLSNLKKTTEQAGGADLFWFTTYQEATPDQLLAAPIWSVAGESPRQCLIS